MSISSFFRDMLIIVMTVGEFPGVFGEKLVSPKILVSFGKYSLVKIPLKGCTFSVQNSIFSQKEPLCLIMFLLQTVELSKEFMPYD